MCVVSLNVFRLIPVITGYSAVGKRRTSERRKECKSLHRRELEQATRTGLEPATTGSTVRDSNQLSYRARAQRLRELRCETRPPVDQELYQKRLFTTSGWQFRVQTSG